MDIQINKSMLNLLDNEGFEFNSTDTVCEKCGSSIYVMKRQKTIFGTQANITCKKCNNIIRSDFRP